MKDERYATYLTSFYFFKENERQDSVQTHARAKIPSIGFNKKCQN